METKKTDPAAAKAVREAATARTDTYTIKGGSDVVWGVDETSTDGIVISAEETYTGRTEEVPNAQGAITGVVIYDVEQKAKISIIADVAAVLPTIGSNLTIGTVVGIVTAASVKKSNKSLKMIDVDVSCWTNFTRGD